MGVPSKCTIVRAVGTGSKLKHTKETTIFRVCKEISV